MSKSKGNVVDPMVLSAATAPTRCAISCCGDPHGQDGVYSPGGADSSGQYDWAMILGNCQPDPDDGGAFFDGILLEPVPRRRKVDAALQNWACRRGGDGEYLGDLKYHEALAALWKLVPAHNNISIKQPLGSWPEPGGTGETGTFSLNLVESIRFSGCCWNRSCPRTPDKIWSQLGLQAEAVSRTGPACSMGADQTGNRGSPEEDLFPA